MAAISLELIRWFRYCCRVQQLSVARRFCLVLSRGTCIVQGFVCIIDKAVAHNILSYADGMARMPLKSFLVDPC